MARRQMATTHHPTDTGPRRERGVERHPFPAERRLVIAAERAGRHMTPMHGLVELDVTEARRLLAEHDPPLSFTAFLIASVARAAAAHPEVHAYRDWRGRVVTHRHADVATIVEIETPGGPFPMAHVVRDADVRSVADITEELRTVKRTPRRSRSGAWLVGFRRVAVHAPGLVPILTASYRAAARSVRAHRFTGTIALTSVGMFGGGNGFGIAEPTMLTLQVVVGGVSRQPCAVDGHMRLRDVLDLTVTLDHNVVDGAPAARFARDLRALVESASALR